MRHEPSYDGLRTVAVGAVVAVHAGVPFSGLGLGVEIFFALSGYLITRILLAEEARCGRFALGRFYWRRVLRLMPALVVLVAAVLGWAAVTGRLGERLFPAAMALFYLMNLNRAFEWGAQDPLGHTWSLAMEEQFYLLWPLLLMVVPARRRAAVLVGLVAAICAWRGWLLVHGASTERVYNGFDTHAETLLTGCLLAVWESSIPAALARRAARLVLVPIALIAAQMLFFARDTALSQGVGNLLIGLTASWLIFALPRAGWPRRLLSIAPMRFLGRISYGIYLWHYPLFQLGGDLGVPHWRVMVPALSVLAATLSYYAVERRFLRLRDRDRPPGAPADLAEDRMEPVPS